jgi:ACS family glucarate transporter-like MFS transporter
MRFLLKEETTMAVVRHTRIRYFLGFWLFILSGVAFLDRTNISIAGLDIIHDYGLNNQSLGWILSAFLIGYAGLQIPAGILAARFGPRRVLTLGVIWWGAATLLTTVLPTNLRFAVVLLIGIRFLLGAGEAVIYPSANQFVAAWIPQQERGLINGLIFAGVGVGSGLTAPLLTWIILGEGWRASFWFSAAVGCIAGAVWWIFSRDTPEEHPGVSRAELNEIRTGLTFDRSDAGASGGRKAFWRALFGRPDVMALMAGYFCFGYVAWIFFGWFFIYMAKARGFDLRQSGLYAMLPPICMTIFSLVGGSLSDQLTRKHGLRVGRCYLASFSLVLTSIFLLWGSQVHSPQLGGVTLAGAAGALYLSQSTFWSVSVDIAGRNSGIFSSMVNMAGQIGGALTASLTPWIAQRFGWTTAFAVAAGLAVVGAACWLVVHPEQSMEA